MASGTEWRIHTCHISTWKAVMGIFENTDICEQAQVAIEILKA